jgi:hypothetical protein
MVTNRNTQRIVFDLHSTGSPQTHQTTRQEEFKANTEERRKPHNINIPPLIIIIIIIITNTNRNPTTCPQPTTTLTILTLTSSPSSPQP